MFILQPIPQKVWALIKDSFKLYLKLFKRVTICNVAYFLIFALFVFLLATSYFLIASHITGGSVALLVTMGLVVIAVMVSLHALYFCIVLQSSYAIAINSDSSWLRIIKITQQRFWHIVCGLVIAASVIGLIVAIYPLGYYLSLRWPLLIFGQWPTFEIVFAVLAILLLIFFITDFNFIYATNCF